MESNMENNIRFLIQREILLYFLNKGTAYFAMKESNNERCQYSRNAI